MRNNNSDNNKITAPVEGMTCASCVARVEKALGKVEGIKNVSVNFASEKATFEVDPDSISYDKIKQVVDDAGYKINLDENNQKSKSESGENEIDSTSYYEKEIKKEFLFGLVLSIPILAISMGSMWQGFGDIISISRDYINKILFLLTTPVVFISGKRFFVIFWKNLKHFSADMNSLVAVGTGTAFIFSTFVTLFPGLIIAKGESAHVYFDTAVVIITLILMGRWLEARAKSKTNTAIKKLMGLKPKTAFVKRGGEEIEIKLEELIPGDIVIIKPGGKIPADGNIISGNSVIDESMVTGESIPVEKSKGSEVIGGTINKTGSFEFKVSKVGDNSVLGQIIKMVEEAQGSKAPIQDLADKVAAIFVPAVIGIAIITFIGWMVWGANSAINLAIINFVAVLIIACPCALGLATPTALMVGTGKGAQLGILIKNGSSLQIAQKISTIIFDKTGTLTEGHPEVTEIVAKTMDNNELIKLAASAEKKSEHPIAESIVNYARDRKIKLIDPESFNSTTGQGINAVIEDKSITIGNMKQMKEYSTNLVEYKDDIERITKKGSTVIFINIDGKLEGILGIEDPLKSGAFEAIKKLRNLNIKTVMITGDNRATAENIAQKAGIDFFEAEVMPEDKANAVKKYQDKNEVVAMVGDGINDAPALAQSDIGIAIGSGADIAMETGSIILMGGDLNGVYNSIKLSGRTITTIKQNLFWAFIYNTIGIPLAAFGLLNPMFAAFAMSFSSVSVVSNSLRLKNFKLK